MKLQQQLVRNDFKIFNPTSHFLVSLQRGSEVKRDVVKHVTISTNAICRSNEGARE